MRILCAVLLLLAPLEAQEALNVTSGLRGMTDEYLTAIASKLWSRRAAAVAQIRTPDEVRRRQAYVREKIVAALGGWPQKTPLNARITGALEREGYRIEKLVYESLPGFHVTANVYTPSRGRPPFPAVVGVAGHSATGKAFPVYQRAWIGLVKRGILVIAIDPPGQGERYEYWDSELGRSMAGGPTAEHSMAGIQCLLTGTNFARYETWDGIRAVDYLLTRGDVDPKRIGVAGNSGGGTQSAYLAAVEPRLAAAAPSCYITSWEKLWIKPGPQDAEQNFVGFLSDGLDFADFLISFAPKPIKVLTAIRDYFPIEGARATYAEARRIYEALDAPDRIDFFEYDDPHGWSKPRREATYRWMQRWLNNTVEEGLEGEFDTEPESALNVTPTGQLATSFQGETVHSLNRAHAERLYASRKALELGTVEQLRSLIAARVGFAGKPARPAASKHGEIGRDGYRVEKLLLDTEPGVRVPALAFLPAAGAGPKAAVLYLHGSGKSADAAPGGDIEALVRSGRIVLAIDPRGWGEGQPGGTRTAMRALLVGKTMLGMQLTDTLAAFEYLASRPDVEGSRIAILGKQNGGVLALYTAALEPRIERVAVERAVPSYMAIVRARRHEGILDIVVPGVLHAFDLPDLTKAITPRKLWIVDPRSATGAKLDPQQAVSGYASARVIDRPEGWAFERVYADWLR